MAAREQQNFEIRQGDERQLSITVYDSTGALLDLTGASARWVLISSRWGAGASLLLSKTVGVGITIPDQVASKGVCIVELDPSDTSGLEPRGYAHQLRVSQPGGEPELVTDGVVDLRCGAA